MDEGAKKEALLALSEAEFRQEVLVPLLRKMGYRAVRERHGPNEYGKDITCRRDDPLGSTYYAVVAKIGNISGAASGKANLQIIKNQINQAFDLPIEDVEDQKKHRVNSVIVWTTGRISNNAEKTIIDSLSSQFRNVIFKPQQATIELLDEYYPGFYTVRDPAVWDYFVAASEHFSRIDELKTLGASSESHPLPTIFVAPVFSRFPNAIQHQDDRSRVRFESLMDQENDLILLGAAGSGKSTVLRHILLRQIEDNTNKGMRFPLPILVELKYVDIEDEAGIEKAMQKQLNRFGASTLAQNLSDLLAEGKIILLVDGLDELKTDERIELAAEHLREFKKQAPNNRLILSSRLLEIFDSPEFVLNAQPYQIEALDTKQMIEFVRKWYGDHPIGKRLEQFLHTPDALRGLPKTPFTLALVAVLYSSGAKEIPANLTELFDKYVELALGRWDELRDISHQFEWKIKQFLLEKVAWKLSEERQTEIQSDLFRSRVVQFGQERGLKLDALTFTDELLRRSELLIEQEDNYEFKHRSFQDYFAGRELGSKSDRKKIVSQYIDDPWWSQTIFFACGLNPSSDDFIEIAIEQLAQLEQGRLFEDHDWTLGLLLAQNAGSLAQAAYLAPMQTKLKAVEAVITTFINAWEAFSNWYSERETTSLPRYREDLPVHFVYLSFWMALVASSLGSITLKAPLAEYANRILSRDQEAMSDRERARHEWTVFFAAVACWASDDINGFLQILDNYHFRDPVFILLSATMADDFTNRQWHNNSVRKVADGLTRKLKGKAKRHRKYLKGLKNPQQFPEPASLGAEELIQEEE